MKHFLLTKNNFNSGSPYSSWLKEQMIGEIGNRLCGFKDRGLAKKHRLRVNKRNADKHIDIIMHTRKLDDYPYRLRRIAVDIIRMELDPRFNG